MIRTEGLTHIHLVVRDIERSLHFYRTVFGMEERFRDGPHMVFVSTPGSRDLITLNQDPNAQPNAGNNGGIEHFGFRLLDGRDFDRAIEAVKQCGGAVARRGEHAPGVPFLYVTDPDGYLIELGAPAEIPQN